MIEILQEQFFYEFFIYKATLGKYVEDVKLISVLADIFHLEDKKRLNDAVHKDYITEILTEEDYKQNRRIHQYCNTFLNDETDVWEDRLISLKGEALIAANLKGLYAKPELSSSLIKKNLMYQAKKGSLIAMRMLGVLYCEGILVEKNLIKGIHYLEKASSWADITATLSLLLYKGNKKETLEYLTAIVKDSPFEDFAFTLVKEYGIDVKSKKEIFLLKQAIALEKVKLDEYNAMYARLIYASSISIRDKEKILFSENKELLTEACDLPLRLAFGNLEIKPLSSIPMPLHREKELTSIYTAIRNSDLREMDSYHPLCLTTDSNYLLEVYLSAIKECFSGEHIECIEMSDLQDSDFEPTKNHIFIRNIEDKRSNVYFLIFQGEIQESILEQAKSFLKTEKRKKFHLNQPAITLDLSSVLPICICDKANYKKLKSYVEGVKIAQIMEEEKPIALENMFQRKCELFKVQAKNIDKMVVERLSMYNLETAEKIMERAILDFRVQQEMVELTLTNMQVYFMDKPQNQSQNGYGFGGNIDENRK